MNLYGFVEGNADFTNVRDYLQNSLTADDAGLGLKCAVVSEIDNTPPVAAWTADPEVLTYEAGAFSGGEIGDSASFYGQWVKHPTPGNVTFTVTAQDKESGIDKIVALTYHELSTETYTDDDGNEQTREIKIEHDIVVTPDSKTGIWSWDGSQNPVIMQVDDGNGKTINQTTYLPLVITYYDSPESDTVDVEANDDGDQISGNISVGDKKAVKTLVYTFTDSLDLTGKNGIYAGMFVNSLGGSTAVSIGFGRESESKSGISTEGIIYKMPIEEGVDYQLVYTDKKGNELTDMATAYYNSATAEIKILERGETRGLYVSNNSRAVKKELNIYQPQFTVSLRDKFGYTKDVTAQLEKTDTKPGEIEYSLYKDGEIDTPLDDGKTNRPIEIRIAFSDYESGIQSFTLSGTDTITLEPMDGSDDETGGETTTDYGTEYECYGTISGNGTYNIVLYDKAGNKTVETFSISNVNTEFPTATSVTFNSPGQADVTAAYNKSRSYYLSVKNEETEQAEIPYYTSRPVTAALSFSKNNVRITSVKPTTTSLTEADYIVNYSTSEITFLKSGTLDVAFSDDYGNTSTGNLIGVDNIDQTPPEIVPAAGYPKNNGNSVDVIFELDPKQANVRGGTRKAADILVAYGGLVKPLADDSGEPTVFTFTEDRSYTLKVYDRNEPLASYYTLTVEIDKSASKITLLEWWYGDTETAKKTVTPSEGALGYRVATDLYDRAGEDVTVRITTDAETRLSGAGGDESTMHTRVWDENGLFSFDTEKKNGQITSYGVDIRVIDKTPPVIDLGDTYELIYCELDYMNNGILDLGPLKTALKAAIGSDSYTAYDEFDGARTVLTDKVIMSFADSAGNTLNLDLFLDYLSSKDFDSSKPYTVTYTVSDAVGNKATAYRTVKLVGRNDTLVLVNGTLPDSTGKVHMSGSSAALELVNFSGTAYVKYQKGLKTMGQMKTIGEILSKNERGEYVKEGLSEGWHTFYIQTDKREYFTIGVYTAN